MTDLIHYYWRWVKFWTWTPVHLASDLPGAWTLYNLYRENADMRRCYNIQRERIDDLERRCLYAGV